MKKKMITAAFTLLQLLSLTVMAQNTSTITGFVKDEKGDPLPFATVLLGNGKGVVSDLDGFFSIEIPAQEESMEMSIAHTGYSSQTTLWTNAQNAKPMKFWLKAGIEMKVVEVIYKKPQIEQDNTCCCQMIRKDELLPRKIEIELFDFRKLEIFPNPFLATLNVEMDVAKPQPHLFHLYTEAGQLVFAESRELAAGQQTIQLDLAQRQLPEGMYFLRISDEVGEIRTKRLVKVSP